MQTGGQLVRVREHSAVRAAVGVGVGCAAVAMIVARDGGELGTWGAVFAGTAIVAFAARAARWCGPHAAALVDAGCVDAASRTLTRWPTVRAWLFDVAWMTLAGVAAAFLPGPPAARIALAAIPAVAGAVDVWLAVAAARFEREHDADLFLAYRAEDDDEDDDAYEPQYVGVRRREAEAADGVGG